LTNPSKYIIIIKMRKVSLGVVCYATLSVVLILGACMKPVGVMDLLNDERVQVIIGGGETKDKIHIDYEHPVDLKPELSRGQDTLKEDSTVRVRTGNSVIITVSNATTAGYSDIEWFCDHSELTTGISGNSITITAGSAPFTGTKVMHRLVVIGIVDDIPYSTGIFIWVES
jgi:hypothetical protein